MPTAQVVKIHDNYINDEWLEIFNLSNLNDSHVYKHLSKTTFPISLVNVTNSPDLQKLREVLIKLNNKIQTDLLSNEYATWVKPYYEDCKFHFQRLDAGSYIPTHVDFDKLATRPSISVISYWNNDYVGGELVLPDLDMTITPSSGTVVSFDSNTAHGVTPVTIGSRYSSCTFWV